MVSTSAMMRYKGEIDGAVMGLLLISLTVLVIVAWAGSSEPGGSTSKNAAGRTSIRFMVFGVTLALAVSLMDEVAFGTTVIDAQSMSDVVLIITLGLGALRLMDTFVLSQVVERDTSRKARQETGLHKDDGPTRLERLEARAVVDAHVTRPHFSRSVWKERERK